MIMIIQVDTREKPAAIKKIVSEFDKQGISYFRSKLPCGDYMSLENAKFCIDRKQNLLELCKNVCQDHDRFIAELDRARQYGIKLVFLIEHSTSVKRLEDVMDWNNPRLKRYPLAVSGIRLYKILSVLEKTYNTKFYFCSKSKTGQMIIELLKANEGVLK